MNKILRIWGFLFLLTFFKLTCYGQTSTNSCGDEATSSFGQVSYSIGQISYTQSSDVNYTILEGVQQVFIAEIVTSLPKEEQAIDVVLFPNPTAQFVTVKSDKLVSGTLLLLYDLAGNLLYKTTFESLAHIIDMSSYSQSAYLLKVSVDGKEQKVFKIIKE